MRPWMPTPPRRAWAPDAPHPGSAQAGGRHHHPRSPHARPCPAKCSSVSATALTVNPLRRTSTSSEVVDGPEGT